MILFFSPPTPSRRSFPLVTLPQRTNSSELFYTMLRLAAGAAGRVTGRFVAAPVARRGRPSFAATAMRLFSAVAAEQNHVDAASWSDADSSTPGGQLTNLQHRYRRVKAPLRALAPLLNACEKPADLKIAVSAVSLYQQKDWCVASTRARTWPRVCCAVVLDHD